MASGAIGVAKAGAGSVAQGIRNVADQATSGLHQSYSEGQSRAFAATGGSVPEGSSLSANAVAAGSNAPGWAHKLRREQRLREGATITAHTIRDGDRPVAGENPRLKDED